MKARLKISPESDARDRLRSRYDALWSAAICKIRSGQFECDPVLQARVPDQRRGLTLVARPSLAVRRNVRFLLRELRQFEPDQYYYSTTELHVTVLSLFTATIDHRRFFAQKARYIAAVKRALSGARPLRLHFEGITASPGSVMIQGFFDDNTIDNLRDTLRAELKARGLAEGLDQRYRLETAHMTMLRFREPLRDCANFAASLESARTRAFGTTQVQNLSLVQNDWYLSRHTTAVVKRYRLPSRREA